MRATRWMMAAALATGLTAMVDAQQPGRQRPGGGAGGGFGNMTGPASLIRNKAVAEDIKLTEEQLDKLKTWSKENGEKLATKTQEKLKDIPRDETEKRAAVYAEINAETYKELADVLKPEQIKRVKQIGVQAAGLRAFSNPEVLSALKLSDDQKTKVKGVSEDVTKSAREAFQGAFGGGRPDPAKMTEAQAKSRKIQEEGMDKVKAVLTDDQKKEWAELTGAPFDVTKLTPAGGGNRPGAGGAGGNRRPGGTNPTTPAPKQKD